MNCAVKLRSVYGKQTIYPANAIAAAVAWIASTTTCMGDDARQTRLHAVIRHADDILAAIIMVAVFVTVAFV